MTGAALKVSTRAGDQQWQAAVKSRDVMVVTVGVSGVHMDRLHYLGCLSILA